MLAKTLIDQLQSPIPDERKRAIKAIARTKDPDALPHLARIFRDDGDDEIRELARKVGVYIKNNASQKPKPESPRMKADLDTSDLYADEDNDSYDSENNVVEVSENDRKRAAMALKDARAMHIIDKQDLAYKALHIAFTLDPYLRDDANAVGIVEDVTGIRGDAAIKFVLDYDPRTQYQKGSEKRKNDSPKNFDPYAITWNDTAIDLSIFGLAIVIAHVIASFIAVGWLNSLVNDPSNALSLQQQSEFQEMLNTELIPALVFGTIVQAIFNVISILIVYSIIHVVAVNVIGAEGTLRGLVHKLTLFFAIVFAAMIVFEVIQFTINNFLLAIAYYGLYLIFNIGMLIYMGYLISQAYNFKVTYGCATLAASAFISFIIISILQSLLIDPLLATQFGF